MYAYTYNLLRLRLIKGLTQKEMAGKLGISFRQYRRYEKGKSFMNTDVLQRICLAFEVPPSKIIFSPNTLTICKKLGEE